MPLKYRLTLAHLNIFKTRRSNNYFKLYDRKSSSVPLYRPNYAELTLLSREKYRYMTLYDRRTEMHLRMQYKFE